MRKVLCCILVILMVLQMTIPALAYTSSTINNSMQENQTILEKLQSMYGDELTEDDIVNELSNMGLLDEGGNLNVTESIMVDGTPMTLEQVKQMLYKDDADLSKVVSVDGTELKLADLKIMIEIEEELARLKREYFYDAVPLTDEHNSALKSLVNQIESQGISLLSGETEIPINHDLRIKVNIKTKTNFTAADGDPSVLLEFSVVNKEGILTQLPYDVSFKIRTLEGSAKDGIHYEGVDETLTFYTVWESFNKRITVYPFSSNDLADMRWNGEKVFYIQLYDPDKILFEGDARNVEIPVTLNKTYSWSDSMSFSQDVKFWIKDDNSLRTPSYSTINYYLRPDNGFWSPYEDDASLVNMYNSFITSAEDIHGSFENAKFEYYPYIMIDNAFDRVDTMTTYPMLQIYDSGWKEIENAEYGVLEVSSINYYDYGVKKIPLEMLPVGYIDSHGTQLHFRTYGVLPDDLSFTQAEFTNNSDFTSPEYSSVQAHISESFEILDDTKPSVTDITVPAGEYYSGQTIPVTVEFSEPVRTNYTYRYYQYTMGMRMQGDNTKRYTPEETSTTSKYVTFLYQVPKSPDKNLIINFIANIADMKYNIVDIWPSDSSTYTIPDVEMKIDPLLAFKNLEFINMPGTGMYAPDDTIQVKLNVDTDISEWLEQEDEFDIDRKQLKKVYIKAGNFTYPLIMGGEGDLEGSFYTADIPAVNYAGPNIQDLKIELYKDGAPVIGKILTTTIDYITLVNAITIDTNSYPENNRIYLTAETSTKLSASVMPEDATYKDITWESNNEAVAVIDEDGIITPIVPGFVKFMAFSDNGGFSGLVTAETPEFEVLDGGPPAIVFPAGNNSFYAKKNEPVRILWGQNLIGRTEGVSASFNVEIFDGYYLTKEPIGAATPVYLSETIDVNSIIVPENILSKVSADSLPAYTVRVSSQNPDNISETLSAIGYILVYPRPAKVKLNALNSYYITDETSSINIGWELEEFSGGEFEFKVVKNQNTLYTDISAGSSAYTLTIDPVPADKLKDIYTVSVKAKNTQDKGYSTDSFLLHVYNKNSMYILTDNKDIDSVILDNNDYIKALYEGSGSQGILELNREISLKRYMGINYSQYPWGNITDQIKWSSDNSKIASVNYKQGTLYENIEKFDYKSYRPSTEFMLAGNSDGRAAITATHAATGITDTLNVDVKTLKDKLYIFNFYPKQETELEYTNGSGQLRTLKTNSAGEIAIYEESGIKGSISLKSGSDSNLYLGTLYNERLVSAERDPGIYELYPVNIFELRPAAKVQLFFKNSEGQPFSGEVTYRGAVYKNGKICNETMEIDGQLLSIGSDGRFILNFDTTKFWTDENSEKLSGSDKLNFIYEVIFNNGYYPQLLEVNGNITVEDTVKFGESIVNLVPVNATDTSKPFVQSHKINYNLPGGRTLDVTKYTGAVGPGNTYPTADLESTVTWWGCEKKDGYDVKRYDEYGALIDGQKVKTILYPWSLLAYTKNITTMTEESLNLEIGEKKAARLSLFDTSGSLLKQTNCPFMLTNMVGAPDADDDDKGVKKAAEELNESGNLEFDGSMVNNGDSIIGIALDLMSGTSLGGQLMNLRIIATEDPMIYRGLITMQQGMGSTDASSVTVDVGGVETSFDYTPDPAQMMDLLQKSADDLDKELTENMEKTVSGGVDYGLTITGYFEVEVRYDYKAEKWIMVVIGGGFDLDALIGYIWTMNQMAGPVPITGEFSIGAACKLEFRAIKPYGNVPSHINAADVNDFFTALRIKLYVGAFGGFGFDYSIVALKIGVFGKINLDYELEFLNRSYLAPPPHGYGELYGIELGLTGQVGIKFVAKLLFISYEAVLASYEYTVDIWKDGNPELIKQWKDSQNSNLIGANSIINTMYASSMRLRTVKESLNLEGRDYLEQYNRSWGNTARRSMMLLLQDTKDIQTNSYPYSNPVVTNDGGIMVYMSDSDSADLNETRASWAVSTGIGEYQDMGAIQEVQGEAYADNNLTIDGDSDFVAAAWEQQSIKINTEGSLTEQDISAMINSSEIVAGIYDGNAWETTALTDNMVSDMAPVTAARQDRAVVTWRSLAGSGFDGEGADNPLVYDNVNDSILFKVYENGDWSDETYTLYNSSSGNVRGLSAAMMPDGTTGIVYTLDYGPDGDALDCETILAIIDNNNYVIADIRLTCNDSADLNPQIAAVDFGSEEGSKFVVGWYNVTEDGVTDIKFAAADSLGNISNEFIDSINSIDKNSAVIITDSFKFVKKSNLSIDDFTIVWVEPTLEFDDTINRNAENDCLKAVKFMRDTTGKIYLTAPLDVATMNSYTLIDHLDAYSDSDNTVKAVMLCSTYEGQLEDQGGGVYTVDSVSSMKYAEKTFENNINIRDVYIDYNEIKNNFRLPIIFTVTNMGIEPISSINIELQSDDVVEVFDNLNLLPNQSMSLTVYYDVPGEAEGIHDLDYIVAANFTEGDIKEKTGLLNLDIPDTGIAKVELVSDEQGKRVVQLSLHNISDIPLTGSNRRVYAGLYTSSLFNNVSEVGLEEITGGDLELLDEGALTKRFTYNVPPAGIPAGGVRLYAKIWVEEKVDDKFEELIEYNPANNNKSILIPNPTEANNGRRFLVTVVQENSTDSTTAHVTVKNLSMEPSANGNVILQLMDDMGKVIETKFLAATSQELLSLEGEESKTRDISFTRLGSRVTAEYFTADSSMDPAVSNITLEGIAMNFEESVKNYSLNTVNLSNTLIKAAAKNTNHRVEIRNAQNDQLLAEGTGYAAYNLSLLPYNEAVQVKVTVTNTETQAVSDAYNISVLSTKKAEGLVLLPEVWKNNNRADVHVTAEDLKGFTPVKWQMLNNSQWSELFPWDPNTNKYNIYTINKWGEYTLTARLFDEDGYYMDTNTILLILAKSNQ